MAAENASWAVFDKGPVENVIDTSKKVRIGIVGCGWIGGVHLEG